jgi:hypothetical protein
MDFKALKGTNDGLPLATCWMLHKTENAITGRNRKAYSLKSITSNTKGIVPRRRDKQMDEQSSAWLASLVGIKRCCMGMTTVKQEPRPSSVHSSIEPSSSVTMR